MSRRKARTEAHVRLYRHELNCDAYRSLSPEARALLIEFRALYNGRDNRIYMSVREMMRRLNGTSQRRATRARDELLAHGFIRMLTCGSFERKSRRATEYMLTNEPLDNNHPAPKDFMRWQPKKNTVFTVDTHGTHSEYREPKPSSKKERGGTHGEYRQASTQDNHGTPSEYTDKLPRGRNGNWLSEYMGWPCRNGSVLNACCPVCGVWITSGGYEFNSGKHSCDPISRAKYQNRLKQANEGSAAP